MLWCPDDTPASFSCLLSTSYLELKFTQYFHTPPPPKKKEGGKKKGKMKGKERKGQEEKRQTQNAVNLKISLLDGG